MQPINPMNTLGRLKDFGQSVWYDNIERAMLGADGALQGMIAEDGLCGITSNPTIFEKAIAGSADYDQSLLALLSQGVRPSGRDLFFALAIEDIQQAADLLLSVYKQSEGLDGYVSLEVSPDLAYDAEATIAEARRLVQRVNRPNLMVKVPATREGVAAVEALTAEGVNVNATLLFSVKRYEEVARAYLSGLRQRHQRGLPVDTIASVASFFVSRVDAAVDRRLEEIACDASPAQCAEIVKLQGKIAIANAKAAYQVYLRLSREEFSDLAALGAMSQRLLWASTGTKNPRYSDVLYVDALIGRNTVNTLPPATYRAFRDHGTPSATLEQNGDDALAQLARLADLGVDMEAVAQQLEDDGVKAFQTSFDNLLNAIEQKVDGLAHQRQASA